MAKNGFLELSIAMSGNRKIGSRSDGKKSAGTRFQVHVTRTQWESLRRNLRKISVRWSSEKINQPSCCEFRRDRCAPELLLTVWKTIDVQAGDIVNIIGMVGIGRCDEITLRKISKRTSTTWENLPDAGCNTKLLLFDFSLGTYLISSRRIWFNHRTRKLNYLKILINYYRSIWC